MKTPCLVGVVAAVHVVAVGLVFVMQGCGTTRAPEPTEPAPLPSPVGAAREPLPGPVDRPPVRSWPTDTTVYIVRKGDCISDIARAYGVNFTEIVALNNISDPNRVRVGQKLVLPGKIDLGKPRPPRKTPAPPRKTPAQAASPVSSPAPAGGASYEVKAGDTLSGIAVRLGTTVKGLRAANRLSGDKILVGQKLSVPGGKPSEPTPHAPVSAAEPAGDPSAGAPLIERLPEPAPQSTPVRMHEVGDNEDLFSVSLMWGVPIPELQALNGLTNTSLRPGQVLKIPVSE
ncbi:LysM peptidoglycan-binding domain-containing protein [Verrucomicrobiota bacterium]